MADAFKNDNDKITLQWSWLKTAHDRSGGNTGAEGRKGEGRLGRRYTIDRQYARALSIYAGFGLNLGRHRNQSVGDGEIIVKKKKKNRTQ